MLDKFQRAAARERSISEDQIEAFTLRLEKFLLTHLGDVIDGLKFSDRNAVAAAKALLSLEAALSDLGLDDVLEDLTEIYGDKLNYISRKFDDMAGTEIAFNDLDIDGITQLIKFDIEAVKLKTYSTVADLRSAVMRSVILGENPRKLWRDEVGNLVTSLDTELNTGLAGFERSISIAKAEEYDLQLFLYAGDIIETTREFCRERAGKVFHVDELDEWDNEQDLPVEQYLGGYNCRHSIDFISVLAAERYEKSDKAQEYIDDVQSKREG